MHGFFFPADNQSANAYTDPRRPLIRRHRCARHADPARESGKQADGRLAQADRTSQAEPMTGQPTTLDPDSAAIADIARARIESKPSEIRSAHLLETRP
jgi:hypothetical protein